MSDSRYLALWKRLDPLVQAYTDAGQRDEADHLMADFFLTFPHIDELERHVAIAEEVAKELRAGKKRRR